MLRPSTKPSSAAIASSLAAELYGLAILEQDIQDNAANATRFLVLGRQCPPATGNCVNANLPDYMASGGGARPPIALAKSNPAALAEYKAEKPSKFLFSSEAPALDGTRRVSDTRDKKQAVLLIGGDKTGDGSFYRRLIPTCERIWKEYLAETGQRPAPKQ